MNDIRVTTCGGTTFMIGQLFDPNDLVDPTTLVNVADIVSHQLDRFGMSKTSNDDAAMAPQLS